VLPPNELTYPDFEADGMNFYNIINEPHLKLKYMKPEEYTSDSDEDFNMQDVKVLVGKRLANIHDEIEQEKKCEAKKLIARQARKHAFENSMGVKKSRER
jgi:hypothetical protein